MPSLPSLNEKRTTEQSRKRQTPKPDPTPDDRLVEVAQEMVGQLVQQTRNEIQAQQGKLVGRLIEVMVQQELLQKQQL